jgi:hypothetical protein
MLEHFYLGQLGVSLAEALLQYGLVFTQFIKLIWLLNFFLCFYLNLFYVVQVLLKAAYRFRSHIFRLLLLVDFSEASACLFWVYQT